MRSTNSLQQLERHIEIIFAGTAGLKKIKQRDFVLEVSTMTDISPGNYERTVTAGAHIAMTVLSRLTLARRNDLAYTCPRCDTSNVNGTLRQGMIEWCVSHPLTLAVRWRYELSSFRRNSVNCKPIYEIIDATRDTKHGSTTWFEQKYPSRLPVNSQKNAFCRLRHMREIKVRRSKPPLPLKESILSQC
jgi:hypothetical protein